MKRTRYDSEYERVKRETAAKQRGAAAPAPAAPAEPRRASPRQEECQRVQAIADDIRERHEALEAEIRERERASSTSTVESARAFNERVMRAEYAARGVTPPAGALVSLDLLLSIGWTITEVMGRPELIRPAPEPERRPRESYDGNT
jgi:hypothetical protein